MIELGSYEREATEGCRTGIRLAGTWPFYRSICLIPGQFLTWMARKVIVIIFLRQFFMSLAANSHLGRLVRDSPLPGAKGAWDRGIEEDPYLREM